MTPRKTTKAELLVILNDIAAAVRANDSFEGSLEYTALADELGREEFMVKATYRVGNAYGQGGMVLVGEV